MRVVDGPAPTSFVQVRRLRDRQALTDHLGGLGLTVPFGDPTDDGPMGRSLELGGAGLAPNRWAVLPMEGWDGTPDGRPTDLVRRRWTRFGAGGAGLVWGGEAVAVVPEGRANPRQLCIGPHSVAELGALRGELVDAHRSAHGTEPVVGLQLTHSGRWSRPLGSPAPRPAVRHPVLDGRLGLGEAELASAVLTDGELEDLVGAFAEAARVAAEAGFDFVDVKQCHGYLAHEMLVAHDRPGRYGGDLQGRTRWVREVLAAVAAAAPGLALGSRLSLWDEVPHVAGPDGRGVPDPDAPSPYRLAFGGDGTGTGIDLAETHALVDLLVEAGVSMLCATAGSPYYVPHIQRPAYFPPSDGYRPPCDPLVDVVRLATATAEVASAHPEMVVVGSGLSYLQDHLPEVASGLVGDGWMAAAGMGRMALSDPTMPADSLAGRPLQRRLVCRTFSDCTTAPRAGLVSGCYPLDPQYRDMPERVELAAVKRRTRAGGGPR